jgi:hypothetical protein
MMTDRTSAIVKTFARNREASSRSPSRKVDSSRTRIIPASNEMELVKEAATGLFRFSGTIQPPFL